MDPILLNILIGFGCFGMGGWISQVIEKILIGNKIEKHFIGNKKPNNPVRIFNNVPFFAIPFDKNTDVKHFDAGVRITRRWKRPRKTKPSVISKSESSTGS